MNTTQKYFVEERQLLIKEYIDQSKRVSVNELIEYFGVSPSTIRNDLNLLEKEGLIQRTHGGAVSLELTKVGNKESYARKRLMDNPDKKASIAKTAASEIEDGDTIALLSGTTIRTLAQALGSKHGLTIVTNDLGTASWFEDNTEHKIFVMGGFVCKHQYYMTFLDEVAANINVDKAFFSCTEFSLEKGATVSDYTLAESQMKLLRRAEKVVLLCDSTKFGGVSFANMASIHDIDILVTDSGISNQFLSKLQNLEHIRVKIADSSYIKPCT